MTKQLPEVKFPLSFVSPANFPIPNAIAWKGAVADGYLIRKPGVVTLFINKIQSNIMSEKVQIQKAKITSDFCLEVDFTENLPGHGVKDTSLSCTIPVHQHLRDSVESLNKHLALAADQIKGKVKDIESWEHDDLSKFSVKGYSKSGGDGESITIIGIYDGKYCKVNMTPKVRIDKTDYPFASELALAIEACDDEVYKYLFEGKRAPEQQMAMEMPEGAEPLVNEE